MTTPRTVWIINIAAERGGATVQAGCQYPEKAQALRVFDELVDLWSRSRAEPHLGEANAPKRLIHELGHTVVVPRDLVSLALMPHVEEQPRNQFGGAVPGYVPDPAPPSDPKAAMIDGAVKASVTPLRAVAAPNPD